MINGTLSEQSNGFQENLNEIKHHKMARSLRSGPRDRELKPDAKTRDLLKVKEYDEVKVVLAAANTPRIIKK